MIQMKKSFLVFFSLLFLMMFVFCSCNNEKEEANNPDEGYPEYSEEYDSFDRVKKQVYNNSDGSVNSIVEYEYDENSNIVSEKKTLADGTFDSMTKCEYKKFGNEFKETKKIIYSSETEIDYYLDDYEYKKFTFEGEDIYCIISNIK